MKERNDSFVNLSNETIDANVKEVFSYGMNCHLKTKFDKMKRKVELELFYENVKDKVRSKAITIENEDNFKCEPERFGTKQIVDHTPHRLTKEQT